MFCDCLYSVNKRAKNFRDKAQSYHYNPYYRGYYQEEDMDRYYGYKDQFLNLLTPVCIHNKTLAMRHDVSMTMKKTITKWTIETLSGKIVLWPWRRPRSLVLWLMKPKPKDISYFLYYVVGDKVPQAYSWTIRVWPTNKPIDDDFMTFGQDTKDLISPQFVLKVLDMLLNQTCELHINGQIIKRTEKAETVFIEKAVAPKKRQPIN